MGYRPRSRVRRRGAVMTITQTPGTAGAVLVPPAAPGSNITPRAGSGPTHPTPTRPTPPPRPKLAELAERAERLGAELLALLDAGADLADVPTPWARSKAEDRLYDAAVHVSDALEEIAGLAQTPTFS